MGFELKFFYYPAKDEGYDRSQRLELVKKIGSPYEDVPMEKVAGVIVAQMARREIWVDDVQVFEFVKKPVAFKQSKNGLVLGGRKYTFDDCGSLGLAEDRDVAEPLHASPPTPTPSPSPQPPAVIPMTTRPAPPAGDVSLLKRRPLRFETYQPDPVFVDMSKARRLPFTVGKNYPIYEEKPAGSDPRMGMNYVTLDDRGQRYVLNDKHFVPVSTLSHGFDAPVNGDIPLGFGNVDGTPMPELRPAIGRR